LLPSSLASTRVEPIEVSVPFDAIPKAEMVPEPPLAAYRYRPLGVAANEMPKVPADPPVENGAATNVNAPVSVSILKTLMLLLPLLATKSKFRLTVAVIRCEATNPTCPVPKVAKGEPGTGIKAPPGRTEKAENRIGAGVVVVGVYEGLAFFLCISTGRRQRETEEH